MIFFSFCNYFVIECEFNIFNRIWNKTVSVLENEDFLEILYGYLGYSRNLVAIVAAWTGPFMRFLIPWLTAQFLPARHTKENICNVDGSVNMSILILPVFFSWKWLQIKRQNLWIFELHFQKSWKGVKIISR